MVERPPPKRKVVGSSPMMVVFLAFSGAKNQVNWLTIALEMASGVFLYPRTMFHASMQSFKCFLTNEKLSEA